MPQVAWSPVGRDQQVRFACVSCATAEAVPTQQGPERGLLGGQERFPEAVALEKSQQVRERSGREAGVSEGSEEGAAGPAHWTGAEGTRSGKRRVGRH